MFNTYEVLPLHAYLFKMNLFSKLSTVIWLFLCTFVAVGQYRFDTWTTDNGLPQNGIRQITQTPEGYLWFTTFDGLVRFDGVRFTTFNKSNTKGIINNRFTGIFGDTDGTLYATTAEDGILTIYRNGVFSSLTSAEVPGHYIAKVEHGPDGKLRFLSEDEDRTTRSWYSLNEGKFEFIEKQAKYNEDRVISGRFGNQWVVTTTGITEIKEGQSLYTPLDLTNLVFRANVFEDSYGSLWIGENRVHRIHNGVLRTFDEKDGLIRNSLYHSFWQEADGSVWVSSGGAASTSIGLVQFNGDNIRLWGKENGLVSSSIESLFHDREGTVWLATDRGLIRRRKQFVEAFSIKDGIVHSEVYPLYRDRSDNIWVGTSRGLSIYRNDKFESPNLKPPSPDTPPEETWRAGRMSIQSFWEDPNGKMWIGLNGGIFTVKDDVAELLFRGSHVFAINNDQHGNVWAATNKGLLRFNDYQLVAQYSTKEGLPNDFMTTIFEDSKGVLWFGGHGGLSKFEGDHFINYTVKEGLAGNYVRSIYEDREGTLWIGTYDEGMSRFKDGKFVSFKEQDGLYNSGVFAIEEDAAGFFWISSNRGIYRVNRSELNDFADGKIAKITSVGYSKEDGMLSTECNGGRQPASLRDKEGRIWFPTQDGISIVDPGAEKGNPMPPTVVVEDLLVDRKAVEIRGGVSIEPGQKDIEIRYTGISLINSNQIRFQYKLENYDDSWVDAGTRRTAYYTNVPPGKYRFLVKAANSDGVWNETGADLAVELKPFFYQTKWFYLLVFLGVVIALVLIWKGSVYELRSRERRLKALVDERTAALAKANEALEQMANSDGLTKIGNRRRFESFFGDEWHRAVRFKTPMSLVMIDIDHFKLYNDTYGHQAGDDCLQRVAEALAGTIHRPTDLVVRFGGEEFAIVLGGTDGPGAQTIAEEAVQSLRSLEIPHVGSLTSEFLTVSVGIATVLPNMAMAETELIASADRALYKAKENGRNDIYVFDHLSGTASRAAVSEYRIDLQRGPTDGSSLAN